MASYKIGSLNITVLSKADIFPLWQIKFSANTRYKFIKERHYFAMTGEDALAQWRNDFKDTERYKALSVREIYVLKGRTYYVKRRAISRII